MVEHPNSPHSRPFLRSLFACLLSLAVVLVILGALFDLDYPFMLFIRSLRHPMLEQLGEVGNRLGNGLTLVLISLGIFAAGYVWKHQDLRKAGWESLLAHAVAGIAVQIPKHVIGRPRPRFTHQEFSQFGPSIQSGLDAFPSGHSAASFAVAAVLARYFPRVGWVWYGMALFVAASRVVRGSHFPTDAMAGSVFGFVVGYLMARSLKDWWKNLVSALGKGLPAFLGSFAILWVVVQRPSMGNLAAGMAWAGGLMVLVGFGCRWLLRKRRAREAGRGVMGWNEANMMMALGLALSTGSLLVVGLAGVSILVWWVWCPIEDREPLQHLVVEGLIVVGVLGVWVTLHQLRGVIPLM